MGVPKRRTTRSKRDMRRAHHDKITAPTLVPCPNCGEMMVPHRVCKSCGFYRGRKVIEVPKAEESESSGG
ncbi:MAG: 50S ribosomal protein L32 [Deltaproteobacteria bacterium]|nr:50S ribosomal protein L32 [Deltaproteobacteria bacterium]MDW8247289.1 50S ribosomal protein L32 [Sandaracinaceae bacterium]